jgi:predicted GH43/DUF377 family glycosyl hydrolase
MAHERTFAVETIATLGLISSPELDAMYTLSPFVWRERDAYGLMIRLVNRSDDPAKKISRIHRGTSQDGIVFRIDTQPAIAPGSGADRDGCEDPTVLAMDGSLTVYYSGWNDTREYTELLCATTERSGIFTKHGTAIAHSSALGNPKEASLAQCSDGSWCMFFEYASGGASKIGRARASAVDGPWTIESGSPISTRSGAWDDWHLSPGPIVTTADGRQLMFYNGSTRQSAWRIGFVEFDRDFAKVIRRGDVPLITPPAPVGDERDIAFAASAVLADDGAIHLYYSVADQFLKRATLRGS